jgi:hypothetical protein
LAGRPITPEEFEEKFAADPLFFIESCLWLQSMDGELVPFRLNDNQLAFYKAVRDDMQAGEPVRYIILKSRRLGFSTVCEGLVYWRTTNKPHTNALVVAQDTSATENVLQITHRFTDNDYRKHLGIMPEIARDNRGEIVFDTHWRERGGERGLDSRFVVATADRKTASRSYTLHAFHGSEVAFWPDATLITGLVSALSKKPGTFGFLESTANGRNGYFYETWKKAEKGIGSWKPWFCSWKEDPNCRIHLSPKQREMVGNMLSDEERKLGKEHGLDLEQLWFRRKTIEDYPEKKLKGRAPEDQFRQEFPLHPEEAFVGTGRQYFSMQTALWYEKQTEQVKYQEGWIEAEYSPGDPIKRSRPNRIQFHPRRPLIGRPCLVRVWKMPEPGADYVIGADTAMGFADGDFSCAYVLRRDTMEVVARLRGHIEPDHFADMLVDLAWFYNEAFLCPENNAIGMQVAKRTSSRYSRHAFVVRMDRPGEPSYDETRPGWNTNPANRREMFAYLRTLYRDRLVRIFDDDFNSEVQDFVVPEDREGNAREDKPRAIEHKHDDCVAALAITLQANDPFLAGVIRRPQPVLPVQDDWRYAAVAADHKKREPERLVDPHLGTLIN